MSCQTPALRVVRSGSLFSPSPSSSIIFLIFLISQHLTHPTLCHLNRLLADTETGKDPVEHIIVSYLPNNFLQSGARHFQIESSKLISELFIERIKGILYTLQASLNSFDLPQIGEDTILYSGIIELKFSC